MKKSHLSGIITTLGAAWLVSACGRSSNSDQLSPTRGALAVELVDAPSTDVTQIVVTVREVTAHSNETGWVTLFSGSRTIDLLTLTSTSWPIGSIRLPTGQVTQIRFVLANGPQYVTLTDGSRADLKVPSGAESGIKLDGPFNIEGCSTTTVTLDFDGKNSISIHQAGNTQDWILRPVIRVKGQRTERQECGENNDGGPHTDHGGVDAGTPPAASDGGAPLN